MAQTKWFVREGGGVDSAGNPLGETWKFSAEDKELNRVGREAAL